MQTTVSTLRPADLPAASSRCVRRYQRRALARSEVAVSASSQGEAAAAGPRPSPLVLSIWQPKREINWDRWEVRLLQIIEKAEALKASAGVDGQGQQEEEKITGAWENHVDVSCSDLWAAHFRQYDDPSVHLAGLCDHAYMNAWEAAITSLGPSHIKGKIVLDLGCGPGVLSLMCAKAGAKKVIAVDGSQAMVDLVRQVASTNGYGNVIEAACARVEELELVERADVLVSNWPGPGLLSGGMLPGLALARQTLLKPDGLVLPSSAEVHVTGIEDRAALAEAKQGWESVAGFDLTPAMSQVVTSPRVTCVPLLSQLCTATERIARIDLTTLTHAEAREGIPATPFRLECQRDERLFGLAVHFDLGWAAQPSAAAADTTTPSTSFTTSARAPPTQFQQVLLNFPRSIKVKKGDYLEGSLALKPGGLLDCDVALELQVSFAGVTAECTYMLVHSVPVGTHAAMQLKQEGYK